MPRSKSFRTPKFRHHKGSNQGYAVIDGQTIYFGRYDDPNPHFAGAYRLSQNVQSALTGEVSPRVWAANLTVLVRRWDSLSSQMPPSRFRDSF
jgi:hypothetical protein